MLNRLFMEILSMSLRGSLVILTVMLVRLMLKTTPKIYSYLLWSVVLFRLICPVSIPAPISVVPEIPPVSVVYTLTEATTVHLDITEAGNVVYAESIPVENPVKQGDPINTRQDNSLFFWGIGLLIAQYIWLFGIVVMALYSFLIYLRLWMRLRNAIPLQGNVYLSDKIPSPFVLGLVRPKIFLPIFLAQEELGYILAHEQHHIRRMDHIFKLLGYIALMLHWFNPLVWVAFILFCKDMEMSCDEAVIKKLGPEIRGNYAASLLMLATGDRSVTVMPLAFGEGDTKERVKNMSRWKKPKLWICILSVLVILVASVALITDPIEGDDFPTTAVLDGPVYTLSGDEPNPESSFDITQSWAGWTGEGSAILGLNAQKLAWSNVLHLPIHKFDTLQELEGFMEDAGKFLSLDASDYGVPSFFETAKKYDKAFFEDNTLVLVYITADSSACRYRVGEIYCDGTSFVIHAEQIPGTDIGDQVMSGWFITVAVPDSMVKNCTDFDADLNNISYDFPRITYCRSESQDSHYTVAVQLPSTDMSKVGMQTRKVIEQAWARYDKLTDMERVYSSHLWGLEYIYAEDWQEAQKIVGLPVENPLDTMNFLRKRNYMATGAANAQTPHIQIAVDAHNPTDRAIKQIDLHTGYTVDSVRVQLSATVWSGGRIYATGSACGGYATFSQTHTTTKSGLNVLVVRAEHTNHYANLEAYWVDDNVLYKLYLVGEKGTEKNLQTIMDRLLNEI